MNNIDFLSFIGVQRRDLISNRDGIIGDSKRIIDNRDFVGLKFGIYVFSETTTNHEEMAIGVYGW